jgi:MFS superfamily sulfate permease-like transporter
MKKQKIFQILNGPLVVVIAGILLNLGLDSVDHPILGKDAHLVQIPIAHSTQEFIGFLRFPQWHYLSNPDVWMTAITLALVASLETLLSLEAIDKLDPYKRVSPPNRELMAQGTGNIVSGLLGGLPVTSVIVRSSANVNAGAKTKVSAILHGILILMFVAFFPQWLNLIPKSALAAILVFTGYKLAKVSIFKEYYRKGWDIFMPFIITILSVILTDLLKGVLIGVAVGIFYAIRINFRTAVLCVSEGNNMMIRLRKDVSFFIKPILKNSLEKVPANTELLIDVHLAEFIDKDVVDTINDYIEHAHLKNIEVTIQKNEHNPTHDLIRTKPTVPENQ